MIEPTAMPETKQPIQAQTSTLPKGFVGDAWAQFETIQWTHDFDKWWETYGREYREHTMKGGKPAEIAKQKNKIAQMRKLLSVVWIESRVVYLKSIGAGPVKWS